MAQLLHSILSAQVTKTTYGRWAVTYCIRFTFASTLFVRICYSIDFSLTSKSISLWVNDTPCHICCHQPFSPLYITLASLFAVRSEMLFSWTCLTPTTPRSELPKASVIRWHKAWQLKMQTSEHTSPSRAVGEPKPLALCDRGAGHKWQHV